MKLLRNLCRILVGAVFIYSGFVKGVDPWGSTYKFIDYFNAFHLSGLNSAALVFAFLLALFEFTVGASLLLNIRTRWAAWGALLFMAVFTPLTFLLALTNPVSDCGCFGDAVTLTNWQTFWKNIVLLACAIFVFLYRKRFVPAINALFQWVFIMLSGAFILSVAFHGRTRLPIIDFRPYAIGTDIPASMRIPEGEEPDQYAMTLDYRNKQTGEVHTFTEENYPWQDTLNWEYVSSTEHLVKKGFRRNTRQRRLHIFSRGPLARRMRHGESSLIERHCPMGQRERTCILGTHGLSAGNHIPLPEARKRPLRVLHGRRHAT